MFTGLVEACVPVRRSEPRGTGLRILLPAPFEAELGDSIAVAGCCLTVAAFEDSPEAGARPDLVFDLSAETLARTWLADLRPGQRVNLERALRVGDRLDGHMVSGHVDARGRFVGRTPSGDGGEVLEFEVPEVFERWLVDKGSVTIDGISLTVVEPEGRRFRVAVIPHTLAVTHLGQLADGAPVNLEADLVGKWVERLAVR